MVLRKVLRRRKLWDGNKNMKDKFSLTDIVDKERKGIAMVLTWEDIENLNEFFYIKYDSRIEKTLDLNGLQEWYVKFRNKITKLSNMKRLNMAEEKVWN